MLKLKIKLYNEYNFQFFILLILSYSINFVESIFFSIRLVVPSGLRYSSTYLSPS